MPTTTQRTQTASSRQNDRQAELRSILEARRLEIVSDLQDRVRRVRSKAEPTAKSDVVDYAETAEADIQDELDFALIQMKTETLERIEEALRRLSAGTFGVCTSCGDDVSESRLRALPFAVRCTSCEQERESVVRASQQARRFPGALFELN